MLCFFQILQHGREHLFSKRIIGDFRIFPDRIRTKLTNISDIPRRCGILRLYFLQDPLVLRHGILHLRLHSRHFYSQALARLFISDHHIEDSAEQRNTHDQDHPGDLIGRIFILADQIQQNPDADKTEKRVDKYRILCQSADEKRPPQCLQQYGKPYNNQPALQDLTDSFHIPAPPVD